MHLVQLLLPVYDASGEFFPTKHYQSIRKELVERFGGVTTYSRDPARGIWDDIDVGEVEDDIIIYEVMVNALDREWWSAFREELRKQFAQDELVIRALPIERL
jgi:hypothetical protein